MKLVVTGGGTGGHVYPALEVGLLARARGFDVVYYGSHKGLEKAICARHGLPFVAFHAESVHRKISYRGFRALVRFVSVLRHTGRALDVNRPDVVFSSGGYSSAAVARCAGKRGIHLVIHEQNSIPGRTNRLVADGARSVCHVFEQTKQYFSKSKLHKTGMPVRRELRQGAQGTLPSWHNLHQPAPIVLVMGGSQGSGALNDAALATAIRMTDMPIQWLHLTGTAHFERTISMLDKVGLRNGYTVKAYLEGEEMASALFGADLVVCRSGASSLAELAAFRKPAILVPFPYAFADHQTCNAMEFSAIGAAELVHQSELTPAKLEGSIRGWVEDEQRRTKARDALAAWDVPDATERILTLICA